MIFSILASRFTPSSAATRLRSVVWPETSVPSSQAIEALFYPGAKDIEAAALAACSAGVEVLAAQNTIKALEGPF